ncbi:MAG: NifB/NifX family molybdenum-iron cluster-binding protein [Kiritimatiellia bacterium]
MKIAIPLAEGKLAMHFGHCAQFAIIEVDEETKKVLGREDHVPPPHEPGVLPKWLAEKGADLILAGGMGQRAQMLFTQNGINVQVGAPSDTPENIVAAYLEGTLTTGVNLCDH